MPLTEFNIGELGAHFKIPLPQDLYYAAAVGALDFRDLKEFTVQAKKFMRPLPAELPEAELVSVVEEKFAKGAEVVLFSDTSDKITYKLAQCCQPIPGDDVFGFQTPGEGLKIHRTDCTNAAQLMAHHGHRVVKTKWAKNKEISFLCGMRITGLDDVGVIQKIANVVTGDLKMNMRSLSIDSHDGIFEGVIMVYVRDRDELDELSRQLVESAGISKAERLEAADLQNL